MVRVGRVIPAKEVIYPVEADDLLTTRAEIGSGLGEDVDMKF